MRSEDLLQIGPVKAQQAKPITPSRKKGISLVVHLVGGLWLLASERGGHFEALIGVGAGGEAIRTASEKPSRREQIKASLGTQAIATCRPSEALGKLYWEKEENNKGLDGRLIKHAMSRRSKALTLWQG